MSLAVIFDMDGLMLDTERIARAAWKRAMADRGYQVDDSVYLLIVGRTLRDAEVVLKEQLGADFPFAEVYALRQTYYDQHLAQHGVPVKPGLICLLEHLKENNIPRAVATSTHRKFALVKLGLANLLGYFPVIVCGDEVPNGKPAPDLFFTAARQLGVDPRDCVVLEDSEAGIRAAHAAGMTPLMIPDLKQPVPEVAALAEQVLPSLEQVIDYIRKRT